MIPTVSGHKYPGFSYPKKLIKIFIKDIFEVFKFEVVASPSSGNTLF